MDLGMTAKARPLVEKMRSMVREKIIPLEKELHAEIGRSGNRWAYTGRQEEIREALKQTAKDNVIHGRGRGFEVSQGRLGPGRIHPCMRAGGQTQPALELLCRRSLLRDAFGKRLAQLGANFDIIGHSIGHITEDDGNGGPSRGGEPHLAGQAHRPAHRPQDHRRGGADPRRHGHHPGIAAARMWTHLSALRPADGPDAVHRRQVLRAELRRYTKKT